MNIRFPFSYRDNPHPLEHRDATMRPSTFSADGTVEAVVASSTPVQRHDARGAFLEILDPAGLDLAGSRGSSVLDSHQQAGLDNVLGALDSIRVEGGDVIGVIRFSARTEIEPIVADVRAGIIAHTSAGYQVHEWREGVNAAGMRTKTAVRWVIREVSFVAVPADPRSRTRNQPPSPPPSPPPSARALTNREIRELGRRSGVAAAVIDDLIDREATLDAARERILHDMVERSSVHTRSAHNRTTLDDPENFRRAAVEGLYTRVSPAFRPNAEAAQFVGLTLPELARVCLNRAHVTTTGMSPASLVTRALGMQTTSDFPQILADTVGRTLREAYAAAPSGIRRLSREQTAPDFRARHRLQLDSTGVLLEIVGEHGEFKSGSFIEGGETYKLATYGKIIGFSRQAIINDDLSAFSDVARRLGQQAAIFEATFLTNLLVANNGLGPVMSDTKNLFDASHGNLAATGAPPSDVTLGAARLARRKQTSLAGALIDVTPQFVLVPPDLETAAEKMLTQIQAVTVADVNVFSRLNLIVEPRLTSATRWYVTADPASGDGLEHCYLSGSPGPQTESQIGFDIDGVRTKIRLDFGGGFVDFRGWYANPGM